MNEKQKAALLAWVNTVEEQLCILAGPGTTEAPVVRALRKAFAEPEPVVSPEELLPCVCGGKRGPLRDSASSGHWVFCPNSACSAQTPDMPTPEGAGRLWNAMQREQMKDEDVPAREEGKINLLCTTDAREWAKEFMRIFGNRKNDIDESLMLTWFANALATGGDCEHRNAMQRAAKTEGNTRTDPVKEALAEALRDLVDPSRQRLDLPTVMAHARAALERYEEEKDTCKS